MHSRQLRRIAYVAMATAFCLTIALGATIAAHRTAHAASSGPALTVDVASNRHAISDGIYGMAQYQIDANLQKELKLPLERFGGDYTTPYNWQQDSGNAGSDWFFMGGSGTSNPTPSGQVDTAISTQLSYGGQTIVTIPTIGYVNKSSVYNCSYPRSQYPAQQGYNPYVHPNGDDCGNGKDTNGNVLTDNNIGLNYIQVDPNWMKAWVQHIVGTYGNSAASHVIYQMDNEPDLWDLVHVDIHPDKSGFDEVLNDNINYASMVKATDPTAQVMGPSDAYSYVYVHLNDKPGDDMTSHGGMAWIPYYLQSMNNYQQQHGTRLLDYLDVHYYGDQSSDNNDATTNAARLDSTRGLWDPTYSGENSLGRYLSPAQNIGEIPALKNWINQYYPGTKLSISEYSFGNHANLNGALTEADVLGIFGREGLDSASLFYEPASTDPAAYSYRMFLNYDGNGSRFGDTSVQSTSANQGQLSVYGAQRSSDGALTLVLINKTGSDITSDLTLQNFAASASAQVYTYSGANLGAIVHQPDVALNGNILTTTYPANSITTIVIPGAGAQVTPTPTSTSGSVTLNPIADRDNYASHTGSETTLDISQYQTAYMKFDLSSVGNSIGSAHLRVDRDLSNLGTIHITAYQVGDNSWAENSNSLPALGNSISTQSSTGSGYVDFDVTSYIQAAKASGNLVTLAINSDTATWQDVFSRENGSNEPELVISSSGGGGNGGTLNPTADRDNYASHNGSETTLDISIYQTAYMKFDLSSLSSTVKSAHLRVYRDLADLGTITITAYQVSDNSWVENSNNLPALGNTISTQTSSASGYVDFDVTSYIQSAKASGNVVTIAINASCTTWQDVFSRENGSNEPELVVS